jgi:RNA polymerase sigma-70 factor (ECF subfamily)
MRDPGEGDAALVKASRDGDREAFALLYHRYKPDVWNLAYLTLGNIHEAEDGLQETFVKALRGLSSSSEIVSVRPWLLTICRNVCLDRLRAQRRRRSVSLDDDRLPELTATASDDVATVDFRRALAALAPEDREAFMLVDVLGYRSHEAAAILGIAAASTLRSRLSRARRQLVPLVSDAPGEPPAEIWGVYHDPPESAIVACFPPETRNGRHRKAVAKMIEDVRREGDDRRPRARLELIEFFDRLDYRIPSALNVLAVVDGRYPQAGGSAWHWLADHPRWQMRRAVSYASWLLEVESLLKAAGSERREAALEALATPTPFLWTNT